MYCPFFVFRAVRALWYTYGTWHTYIFFASICSKIFSFFCWFLFRTENCQPNSRLKYVLPFVNQQCKCDWVKTHPYLKWKNSSVEKKKSFFTSRSFNLRLYAFTRNILTLLCSTIFIRFATCWKKPRLRRRVLVNRASAYYQYQRKCCSTTSRVRLMVEMERPRFGARSTTPECYRLGEKKKRCCTLRKNFSAVLLIPAWHEYCRMRGKVRHWNEG